LTREARLNRFAQVIHVEIAMLLGPVLDGFDSQSEYHPQAALSIEKRCARKGTSEEAAEEPGKPQPGTTVWAIGSMEWLAAQKKTR
jgi:hypothetical protein